MTAPPLTPIPASPRWEFLLSHHYPERWSRTLTLSGGGMTLHLCSRCTGVGLGFLIFLFVFRVSGDFPGGLTAPAVQLPFAVGPLLAAWDWTTQSMGERESTTPLRLTSGLLLGLAYTDAVALLILHEWIELAIAIGVFLTYAGAIVLALWRSGSLQRVVADHFPGSA